MRADVLRKFVFFDIVIDIRDIIACLKNNNFFLFSHMRKTQVNDDLV